jgi:diadenosine tetraphosphate (Ap4A) HIT family hydrolase
MTIMTSEHKQDLSVSTRECENPTMTDNPTFSLDQRLAADTTVLGDWPLSRVLLMDDRRYPWIILVPRRVGTVELHALADDDRAALMAEITRAGAALSRFGDKVNTGALGNVVAQLHIHIIARRRNDPAWPGPVWGHSPREPYDPGARDHMAGRLRKDLGLE